MRDYPTIPVRALAPLRIVQSELAQNPSYLDDPECPYDEPLKEFLRALAATQDAPVSRAPDFLGQHGDKWSILQQEANELYTSLKEFSLKITDSDVAERMSYYRTATSLLEKIVSINERAVGLKHIHEFQMTVLSVFERELETGQRTKVVDALRAKIDEGIPANE